MNKTQDGSKNKTLSLAEKFAVRYLEDAFNTLDMSEVKKVVKRGLTIRFDRHLNMVNDLTELEVEAIREKYPNWNGKVRLI